MEYNDILNIYNSRYEDFKKSKKNWYTPYKIHIFLKCLYIIILLGTVIFCQHYIFNNHEDTLERILLSIFSVALGIALCGIWALILKLIFYFTRKSMLKKLPLLLFYQQELLKAKKDLIDSFKKQEGATLVRPFDKCPLPSQLKDSWKNLEETISHNQNLIFYENANSMRTRPWKWFLVALAIVVITIVVVVAIIVAYIILVVGIFLIGLLAMVISKSPYYERDYYNPPIDDKFDIKYDGYSNKKKKRREPDKRFEAYKIISKSKKEIKNIKNLLTKWGLTLLDI